MNLLINSYFSIFTFGPGHLIVYDLPTSHHSPEFALPNDPRSLIPLTSLLPLAPDTLRHHCCVFLHAVPSCAPLGNLVSHFLNRDSLLRSYLQYSQFSGTGHSQTSLISQNYSQSTPHWKLAMNRTGFALPMNLRRLFSSFLGFFPSNNTSTGMWGGGYNIILSSR